VADVFTARLDWSGAAKGPTRDAASFSRDLIATFNGVTLPMSAAPGYHGDPSRVNPEQLLVVSVSACHALTYLFLAARNHIGVTRYVDDAEGELGRVDGRIRMSRVTLRPRITIERGADVTQALALAHDAHKGCFIGNSLVASIEIEPTVEVAETATAAT
jgi:organic hydroperoxide reductase OsmC/OhrA